jgi:hypothetical protein
LLVCGFNTWGDGLLSLQVVLMKWILEVIEYLTGCMNAISKGAKIILTDWPTNNPFVSGSKKDAANE